MHDIPLIATVDPHAARGPHTLAPAERVPDERAGFFQPEECIPPPYEEEAERWDGLA